MRPGDFPFESFLTAACCLGQGVRTIDGIPRMRERPIEQLVDPLRELGADIQYTGNDGFPPLAIKAGQLHGGNITLKPTLQHKQSGAHRHAGNTQQAAARREW